MPESPITKDGLGGAGHALNANNAWNGADVARRGSAAKPFSAGSIDVFHIRRVPDIGDVEFVEIGHREQHASAAWLLEWVHVHNVSTGHVVHCQCGQWLDATQGDG